jgi:hypothetical protein
MSRRRNKVVRQANFLLILWAAYFAMMIYVFSTT